MRRQTLVAAVAVMLVPVSATGVEIYLNGYGS
jgi:hypothetical protein